MAGITSNTTAAWVAQQARNVVMELDKFAHTPTHLIHDNDATYHKLFDEIFEAEGLEVVWTTIQGPNMNAFIERWIQSFQVECLDHFAVFGEDYFRYLIDEYLDFYNGQGPHQSLDNLPLVRLNRFHDSFPHASDQAPGPTICALPTPSVPWRQPRQGMGGCRDGAAQLHVDSPPVNAPARAPWPGLFPCA